jgi:hypothetical protein
MAFSNSYILVRTKPRKTFPKNGYVKLVNLEAYKGNLDVDSRSGADNYARFLAEEANGVGLQHLATYWTVRTGNRAKVVSRNGAGIPEVDAAF